MPIMDVIIAKLVVEVISDCDYDASESFQNLKIKKIKAYL